MRAKLVRLAEVTDADWMRWSALAERSAEPNLAFDPRFLMSDQEGDTDDYLFVIAEEAGEWFGLLRVFAMALSPSVDIPAYGTWDPPLFGASHPLLDRARAAEALSTLARGLRPLLRTGYLSLRGYPATGPLAEALGAVRRQRAIGAVVTQSHASAWVDVAAQHASGSPADRVGPAQIDIDHHNADTRKKLRRAARRLAETAGGSLTLRDASDDPEAVERFIAMQRSGWKGDAQRGGTAVALDHGMEVRFRRKLAAFRGTDDLIVLELWAGDVPVHSSVYLVEGRVAEGYLDAYQHEFGAFSAGKLGRTAAFAYLRRLPRLTAVNPGIYDYYPDAAKVYPDRREYIDVIIGVGVVPSLLTGLLLRADASSLRRRAVIVASNADRFAMRAVGAVKRRVKPGS
ncbi:hypothetical protein JOD63_002538 [Microbacterium terrae]|uniref:BioF2-like acetyltransferase domain-containing protein n=1 Tax=Microbacterium terrae TaxID=69369 RepID=A0A0M2HER2_9MICO|nr:GNAT family N-acetyltransferase [Microbacterium terrae]KJL42717.1 hypothetical protein RS81_01058 [Microbacterium terrae]MBP1078570.1 hypothetical protein [Microbacterium terrae]